MLVAAGFIFMKFLSNSTLETSLHPICLLSSTDTPTFSLYYSFFLLSLENLQNDDAIIFRIPAERDRLDDIESAVKYFVSISTNIRENDSFGSFVITTSDGSRYFAVWRASHSYLLVAVSIKYFSYFICNLDFNLSSDIIHTESIYSHQ